MLSEDTEITLGVGRLLGLFFLLVAICAVFFSIGYSLGKSTEREQALNDQPAQVLSASSNGVATAARSEDKPSAAVVSNADGKAPAQEQAPESNSPSPLTFYKAVQQSGPSAAPPAKDNPPASAAKAPAIEATTAPPAASSSVPPAGAPGPNPPASHSPVTGPGTVVVQIAALSREDDAVSLAGALRKKNYNVIVVSNPATNDKFYHVQVGPFTTLPEAEAMKAKLVAEGYNPIVKR